MARAENSERRKQNRRSIMWSGNLGCGRHHFPCQIFDLSLGGARLRLDLPLSPDSTITLQIRDMGEVPGRVAWSGGGRLGIEFMAAPEQIRDLLGDRASALGMDA